MPSAKSTGHVLKQLRQFMCNKQHVSECLHAYIIPSGDAHQVIDAYINHDAF